MWFSNDISEKTFLLIYDLNAETQKRPYACLMKKLFFVMNVFNSMCSKLFIVLPRNCVYLYAVPLYKELDVFIKRDQETGFGFRVLGGEGAEQPVSPFCFHIPGKLFIFMNCTRVIY